MEKVMNYFTGFFGGLITIMIHIVPVTILWTLLTGDLVFGMDIIANFIEMITALGNAGFVGYSTAYKTSLTIVKLMLRNLLKEITLQERELEKLCRL